MLQIFVFFYINTCKNHECKSPSEWTGFHYHLNSLSSRISSAYSSSDISGGWAFSSSSQPNLYSACGSLGGVDFFESENILTNIHSRCRVVSHWVRLRRCSPAR